MSCSLVAASRCCSRWRGCKVGLYSGLNETEANEVVAALAADGIAARKDAWKAPTGRCRSTRIASARRWSCCARRGCRHERYASMGDVFQKQGLVSTPAEERIRYVFAVSQELSQTLRIDRRRRRGARARRHPGNDPLERQDAPVVGGGVHQAPARRGPAAARAGGQGAGRAQHRGPDADQVSLSLFEARRPASASAGADGRRSRRWCSACCRARRRRAARAAAGGRGLPDGLADAAAPAGPRLAHVGASAGAAER